MKNFAIFLLVMTCGRLRECVPIPRDCSHRTLAPAPADSADQDGGGLKNGDRLHLDCELSAINSDSEKTNFSVIPSEHTVSLTVTCVDSVSNSHLKAQGFKSLIWLEELAIKDCNLERIPDQAFFGLTRLKKLSLESSSSVISMSSGSMDGIANLQSLQVNGVALTLESPSSLCSLPNLQYLNLQESRLQSLDNLGLDQYQSSCLRNLRHLNLSVNALSSLTSIQLQRLPNLEVVDLSRNLIRYLDFDVFSFNPNIKVLNLSDNNLRSLPPSLLPLPSLTHLSLANNTMVSVPSRLFDTASSLIELDLSSNDMTEIKPGLFSNLTGLVSLDLSGNKIQKIRRKSFWNNVNLERLNLKENELSDIPGKLFKSLEYLTSLDISFNSIRNIADEAFFGLKDLQHLTVSYNKVETVGNNSFSSLMNLLLLDLSHNQLPEVPKSLKSLSSVQSLDLSNNKISELVEDGRLDLPLLWRLNLAWNEVERLQARVFSRMDALQILDISNNKIREVERGSFDHNTLLKAVRLDGNRLRGMEYLFHTLPNLTWLNISANRLNEFDYAMLPRSLVWLDLHSNHLESLENYYGIEEGIQIKHLDAGFNRIKILGPANIPNSVETVSLNDNSIFEIAPYTFFEKPSLKKADLTVNNMSRIDSNAIRISPLVTGQPNFLLGGNPIECNCHMMWFRTVHQQPPGSNLPRIQDLESIYCRLPYSRQLTFAPLVDAEPGQFLCPYERHCFALCHCCDYDACDCEMACPASCSCYHDSTWNTNIVVCSTTNATDLPVKLPMDATELLLDGNNLIKLKSHTFIGRKNLRTLYLNNSNIEVLENNTFNGLPSMLVLHLENNRISKFEGDEFQGMVNLRELYLQDNLIHSVNNITFSVLKNLQILHLQGNRLVDFTVWSFSHNQLLLSVGLTENLWSCNCGYLERFTGWLTSTSVDILDQEHLTCTTSDSTSIDLAGLETCEKARSLVAVEESVLKDMLVPVVAGIVVTLFILLIILVSLVYRTRVKLWLYSRYGIRFFERVDSSADQEKIFDAFVIYSAEDDIYVQQVFASELELGANQYRLCLYHRDVGSSHFVSDSILQACDTAKRTILVLSENLIKQEWSRYDFQTGLLRCMRSLGRKLVVIVLGEIKLGDKDPELRSALSLATTIHWGDHKFWEKVKFHLPDTGESHGISQSTTLQSYPSTIQSFGSGHYQTPDLYGSSPRYQSAPGPPTSRPLLSPASPNGDGGRITSTLPRLSPEQAPYSSICLQSMYLREQQLHQQQQQHQQLQQQQLPATLRNSTFRSQQSTLRDPTSFTSKQRNQNMYTMSTNPRHIDHIYQVCM